MIKRIISWLFGCFRRAFLPDKTDLIGSIILSIPLYILFGLSMIFLLPLIIVCVIFVFLIRRLWKIVLMYVTYKLFRRKIDKKISFVKKAIKKK